jgi:hypothetical protein
MYGAIAALLAFAAAPHAEAARVSNDRTAWEVETVDNVCMAGLTTTSGHLALIAEKGRVGFAMILPMPTKPGLKGVLEIDDATFDFDAAFNDKGDYVQSDDLLSPAAVAALRVTHTASVSVDGRTLMTASLAGAGTDAAVDAIVACSRGQAGWWGKGATQTS